MADRRCDDEGWAPFHRRRRTTALALRSRAGQLWRIFQGACAHCRGWRPAPTAGAVALWACACGAST